MGRRARGATAHQPLLPDQPARHEEGLPIPDLDHLVHNVEVHGAGEEILADTLHFIGLGLRHLPAAEVLGEDRAHGIHPHHTNLGVFLLQKSTRAGDRAPRAHPAYEGVDPLLGLAPYLRPGRLVVDLRIDRIVVLVGEETVRGLVGDPAGDGVVAARIVGGHGGGCDHHPGAEGPKQPDLLLAHLVGHDEDGPVTSDGGGDGQSHAGVPGGGLHDGASGSEQPLPFGFLDDGDPDPVLDRAARIQELALGPNLGIDAVGDLVEPDEGCVADGVEDALEDLASLLAHDTTNGASVTSAESMRKTRITGSAPARETMKW